MRRTLDELLPACDFVSVHVPLTEETWGLLGARELGLMRLGSVLVQAARGRVVDESALVEALRYGPLAGAGIDVFGEEPPPADHPLFSVENAVLSPQPVQVQSPPMRSFSMSTTRAPARAANRAVVMPPDPAPMTARSQDAVTSDSFPRITFAL